MDWDGTHSRKRLARRSADRLARRDVTEKNSAAEDGAIPFRAARDVPNSWYSKLLQPLPGGIRFKPACGD